MTTTKTACVDTQILFWSLVQKAPPNDPDAIKKALNLFRWLDEQGFNLIVPSLVVGELLVPVPPEQHGTIIKQVQENWIVVDFDIKVAAEFARLRHKYLSETARRQLQQMMSGVPHRTIVADMMILATALANKADYLITDDIGMSKLAGSNNLDVLGTASAPFQSSFLE